MNDTKQHFYKTLNAIVGTNRIDDEEAYIINDYISRLEATIKDEQEEINKYKEVLDKALYWLSENTHYTDFNVDKLVLDENVNLKELLELLEEIDV